MKHEDPTLYIREMILQFRMPGRDFMTESIFAPSADARWDSGVFISTRQPEGFYADIFQFWVRALFCFFEEMADNSLLESVSPFVSCQQISPEKFQQNLLALVHRHVASEYKQCFVTCFAELQKRSFSQSYSVLDYSDIESSVAESNGEFIAYFHRIGDCSLA